MVFERQVPAGWQESLLGSIADVVDPHPSHRAPEEVEDGVPFAGIGDLSERGELVNPRVRRVSPQILKEHSSRYSLSRNSIGFGRVATIGKVVDFSGDPPVIAISPTMAVIEPRSIDRDYLVQALRSRYVRKEIDRLLTGTTRSSLGIELLRRIHIPVPQDGVPSAIGKILSTVDEAIEGTEKLIAKHQQIKAGLMHDLFTRGLTADGHLRPPHTEAPHLYKDSPLGPIPMEWEALPLQELTTKIADRDHTTPRYVEHGVLMVSPTNLVDDEGIDFDSCKRIPEADHLINREKTDLQTGDLILHRIGAGLGAVRCVTEGMPEFSILHSMAQIRPLTQRVGSEFLLWAFRQPASLSQMGLGTQSIGVPDLGLDKIASIRFPVPDTQEQARIVAPLQTVASSLGQERTNSRKLRSLKRGLMHDLLTGEVDVTVPPESSTESCIPTTEEQAGG